VTGLTRRGWRRAWLAAGALAAFGCASEPRLPPVPEALVDAARVPGIPDARCWGDVPMPRSLSVPDGAPRRPLGAPLRVLAISGGGANGAFAAGLLSGWTRTGTRPSFDIVTGVSAGALAAPFAFLGPQYDAVLRELFAGTAAGDILTMRPRLLALLGDSLADPKPLQALLERHFTAALMQAIAAEQRKGRRLFVGTTNVFASRLVIWDIGAIAASGQPHALELIRRVLLASSAMPILLPPVYFEVEAAGRRYSEMHVDGGMTGQVFIAPPAFDWAAAGRARGSDGRLEFTVIRNGRVRPEYMSMPDSLVPLGEHAMHLLALSQGVGDLYKVYVRAQEEHAAFRAAWIGDDFAAPWRQWYDPEYVRALFDYGMRQALQDKGWHRLPPGVEPR